MTDRFDREQERLWADGFRSAAGDLIRERSVAGTGQMRPADSSVRFKYRRAYLEITADPARREIDAVMYPRRWLRRATMREWIWLDHVAITLRESGRLDSHSAQLLRDWQRNLPIGLDSITRTLRVVVELALHLFGRALNGDIAYMEYLRGLRN